jgi:hypothetical protein
LTGAAVSGGYEYRFVNNSGYEITIYLDKGTKDPYVVPAGETATVTLTVSTHNTVSYNYVGGNVSCAQSGNTLTFANK